MRISPAAYRLYLVTDDPSRYAGDFVENVCAAVEGGVTVVQYRDTESTGRVAYERCRRLAQALRVRGVPLIVNNEPALALAVGADGVHVGQSDMPPAAIRAVFGDRLDIGYSITNLAEAQTLRAAAREDAIASLACVDAVGIGPVFDATATKADAAPAMGVGGLAAIVKLLAPLASVAIGGVNLSRAAAIAATGVGGLCAVSAFSKAADPCAAARAFRAAMGEK